MRVGCCYRIRKPVDITVWAVGGWGGNGDIIIVTSGQDEGQQGKNRKGSHKTKIVVQPAE